MELNPLAEMIIVNFGVSLIVALSLNIEVGYLRIPQFGRLLAVVVGAITAAALPGRILAMYLGLPYGADYADHMYNARIVMQINSFLAKNPTLSVALFIGTLALVALLGGFVGYLCAYPALRLKEAYLGITLLTFGEVVVSLAWNYQPLVGGTMGVYMINPFTFIGRGSSSTMALVILAIAIAMYVYCEVLARSPFGRMLKAIRDSETAAKVYGKDVVKARSQTLILGGSMAAVAGALWAIYAGRMNVASYTRLTWTFWPWAFMMLGGVGNNLGILLGVLLFTLVRTAIIQYKYAITSVIPIPPEWLEYILVGLVIILIVMFRPQGLIPEKPTFSLPRKRIEEIRKKVEMAVDEDNLKQ